MFDKSPKLVLERSISDTRNLLGPNLVVVVVGTLPDLKSVAVGGVTEREVEAEAAGESNAVVIGVVPLLCGKVVVALPDLHLNTVGGSCGKIMRKRLRQAMVENTHQRQHRDRSRCR